MCRNPYDRLILWLFVCKELKLDQYLKQNNIRNYNYNHIQKLL